MEVLWRDPCCAAGLAVLALGGLIGLGATLLARVQSWRRRRVGPSIMEEVSWMRVLPLVLLAAVAVARAHPVGRVRLPVGRLLAAAVAVMVALLAPATASACPLCADTDPDAVPGRSSGDASLLWLALIIGGGFMVMRLGGWLRSRRRSRQMGNLAKGGRYDARE